MNRAANFRLALIAFAVFVLDQGAKLLVLRFLGPTQERVVINGFFKFVRWGNTGAAWSLFSGRSFVLATLAAATLVAIFVGRRALGLAAPRAQGCFGLMCGGIAGNLADRLVRGHVVDFLDFHFGSYVYPTFNLADSAICVGVVLYAAYSLRPPRSAA